MYYMNAYFWTPWMLYYMIFVTIACYLYIKFLHLYFHYLEGTKKGTILNQLQLATTAKFLTVPLQGSPNFSIETLTEQLSRPMHASSMMDIVLLLWQ